MGARTSRPLAARRHGRGDRRGGAARPESPVAPADPRRADRGRRRDRLREVRRLRRGQGGHDPCGTSPAGGLASSRLTPPPPDPGARDRPDRLRRGVIDRPHVRDARPEVVEREPRVPEPGRRERRRRRVRRLPGRRILLAQRAEPSRRRAHDCERARDRARRPALPAVRLPALRSASGDARRDDHRRGHTPGPPRTRARGLPRIAHPVHDHGDDVRAHARALPAPRTSGHRGGRALGRHPPLARTATGRRLVP